MKFFQFFLAFVALTLIGAGIVIQMGTPSTGDGFQFSDLTYNIVVETIPQDIDNIHIDVQDRHVYVEMLATVDEAIISYASAGIDGISHSISDGEFRLTESVNGFASFWRRTFHDDPYSVVMVTLPLRTYGALKITNDGDAVSLYGLRANSLDIQVTEGEIYLSDSVIPVVSIQGNDVSYRGDANQINSGLTLDFNLGTVIDKYSTIHHWSITNQDETIDIDLIGTTIDQFVVDVYASQLTMDEVTFYESVSIQLEVGYVIAQLFQLSSEFDQISLSALEGEVLFNGMYASENVLRFYPGEVMLTIQVGQGTIIVDTRYN